MSTNTNIIPKNNILGKEAMDEDDNKNKHLNKQENFEYAFQNALTIEESRELTLQHLNKLWEKSK